MCGNRFIPCISMEKHGTIYLYPLAIVYSLLLKIAIEIMDLPMEKKHSYVNVYQRVNDLYLGDTCCYRCHWHG